MIGFPIALIFANGFEWYAHKYILHGTPRPGQPRYSPIPKSMKSHWQHHKIVRTTDYQDDGYAEGLSNWRTRDEVTSLLKLTAITSLAMPVAPFFTLGTYYAAARYFYVHRRSHLEPEWGKKSDSLALRPSHEHQPGCQLVRNTPLVRLHHGHPGNRQRDHGRV